MIRKLSGKNTEQSIRNLVAVQSAPRPLRSAKVDVTLRQMQSFPMIESEDEGYPSINWNIGILVDRLIEKKELLKLFRQAKKEKNSLIAVHDTEHNFDYTFLCSETMTGNKLKSELTSLTIEKDIKHFEWTRFDSEEDFNEHLSISI